jgi:hypothetical protein
MYLVSLPCLEECNTCGDQAPENRLNPQVAPVGPLHGERGQGRRPAVPYCNYADTWSNHDLTLLPVSHASAVLVRPDVAHNCVFN